jgi:hypothetical protein
MLPGLSKLPAMTVEQLREVALAHRQTGHKTYGKTDEDTLPPTRPSLQGLMSSMGYLGIGGGSLPAARDSRAGNQLRARSFVARPAISTLQATLNGARDCRLL